jgi:hypothetical protein
VVNGRLILDVCSCRDDTYDPSTGKLVPGKTLPSQISALDFHMSIEGDLLVLMVSDRKFGVTGCTACKAWMMRQSL